MRQVIVVHGGNEFSSYEGYLSFLRRFKVENIDYFKRKGDWKTNLQKDLGEEYEVLLPEMPDKNWAKYCEWEIWFEKLFPFLNSEVILVGHSLGAAFIAKYLNRNKLPKKVLATFLVAGPYDRNGGCPMKEFNLPNSLMFLEKLGGKIFIYHSVDDPCVPFSEFVKYQNVLGHGRAKIAILEGRGHFNQRDFPEIIRDIRDL